MRKPPTPLENGVKCPKCGKVVAELKAGVSGVGWYCCYACAFPGRVYGKSTYVCKCDKDNQPKEAQ